MSDQEKIDKAGLGSIIAAHAAVDMQTMSLNTLDVIRNKEIRLTT